MNRVLITAFLIAVLAAGWIGVLLSDLRWPSADIQRAYAAQEMAKARKLEAEAAAAEAKARTALLDAQVLADAHAQRVQAEQMMALGWGAAVMVFSVGGALSVVVWGLLTAWQHGSTVYPTNDGLYPIFVQRLPGGGLRVLDTSRGLTPVIQIDGHGEVSMPMPASEMTALQLATQAQQAAVMIGVSRRSRDDYDMPERISKAAQNVMTLAQPATGDGVRLVYVNDPRRAQRTRREMELSELREFIQRGWLIGFSREKWLGTTFSCSGRRCSKTYWMTLIDRLSQAQIIEPKPGGGYQPRVTVAEALDTFGLSDQHAAVGQEP